MHDVSIRFVNDDPSWFWRMTSCVSWPLPMASVQPTKPKRAMRPVRVQGDHVCACYRCDSVVADAGGVTYMPCYPPLLHQPDLHDGRGFLRTRRGRRET
jgi:hypothetical protein